MPKREAQGTDGRMVAVVLNVRDEEGNILDTTCMDVSEASASEIIDRAADIILSMRDGKDLGLVASMLDEALVRAGLLEPV